MIRVAEFNELPVLRRVGYGLILGTEGENVPMYTRHCPEGAEVGDVLRVFVYTDTDDMPVATNETPLVTAGQFAALEIVDAAEHGVFAAWGLEKDLFIPWKAQHRELAVGDTAVVYVRVHEATGRQVGTTKLRDHFDRHVRQLEPGTEVDLLVYGGHELGVRVVVNGRYDGMVYRNEAWRPLPAGERVRGWVKAARSDGRIDVALQRPGREGIDDARQVLLDALRDNHGRLALHDKSDPDDIRRVLGMSKKAFKRALGGLYKDRLVVLEDGGIRRVAE